MPLVDLSAHPQLGIYAEDIRECAGELGIDPLAIAALAMVESSGNPSAYNPRSKATGLLQIIPIEGGIAGRPTIEELKSPLVNIQTGCQILREYLDLEDGNLEGALRRYSGYRDKPLEDFQANYLVKFERELAKLREREAPPMSAREVKEVTNITSLHYGPRGRITPSYIILHSTATPPKGTLTGTVGYLRENNAQVSIHELVGPGIVYRMVPDEMAAYHAGWKTSKLPNGVRGALVNVHSWGIEAFQIAGAPVAPDIVDIMLERVVMACKRLGIPAENVLGHRETDPSRRSDPVGVNLDEFRAEVAKRLRVAEPDLTATLRSILWNLEEGRREFARGQMAEADNRYRDLVEHPLKVLLRRV